MMDLIANLNPQQQQAVMAGSGPILVLAGPGSGKTRVLTRRIAYLIGGMGVRPYSLLAVTFTNKAAREMEKRVAELVGENTRGMTLGTFHSICARILRREAEHLPFQSNFVIFDEDDQLHLVKQTILELNLDDKRYRPGAIHNIISTAKNELVLADQFPAQNYRDEVVRRVYKRYQELLLVNNALDFDDLLLWTAYLMGENPAVRDRYARRYEHILVDEFQDTNMAQYNLLKNLASFHNNLFVVGDADQSIYRWRGADYRNVLRFEKDYPDAQVILLEQNYRSTQGILDVAMAVIDRNPYRTPKRLFTDRGEGQKITLYEAYDDRVEAAYVADTIAGLVLRRQAKPGDFAVMYRTNAQSRLLEEAFLAAGMPYKLVGAQRFYGRREVKDLIAFLRLTHNPSDEVSLTRVINVPTRGIGDKTYLALRTQAQKAGLSAGNFLLNAFSKPDAKEAEFVSGRARTALTQFTSHLKNWIDLKTSLPPLALLDRVIEDVSYQSYIDDGSDEGHDRWDNVQELRRLAAEYPEPGLEAFLERVALVSDQDTLNENGNTTTLLTLHAAKGLEFPVVFITGLNDGTLPHSRSFDDPEAMMEERRLLYVGITRAQDRLFLIHAQNRSSYGMSESAEPSRFLNDIPFNLMDEAQPSRSRQRSAGQVASKPERWETPQAPKLSSPEREATPPANAYRQSTRRERRESTPSSITHTPAPSRQSPAAAQRPAARPQARFQPGMHVQHPTWGEGMVLKSEIDSSDEIVDVFFENIGMKRLSASLSRLEIKS
jgi:DNA helicase II / ATP-dependent DNA helicase PcrA